MELKINNNDGFQRINDPMIKQMWDRDEVDNLIMPQGENGDNTAVSYNSMNVGKSQYTTQFGTTVESKYGYAAEFDSISRDYAKNIISHNYNAANAENVVSNMEEHYQSLKSEIETTYGEDERTDRLAELDTTYDFFMKSNVTDATDLVLKNENAINKLRNTFAKAYESAKQTKSSGFVQTAYQGMENWLQLSDEIGTQLDSYKEWFEQFKEIIGEIHKKPETSSYADSLLKNITAGLVSINAKKTGFTQTIDSDKSETVQEIWNLTEQKAQAIGKARNAGQTDSEKYQIFLDNAKQSRAVEQRLDELRIGC